LFTEEHEEQRKKMTALKEGVKDGTAVPYPLFIKSYG
jgi:hypothetical protein